MGILSASLTFLSRHVDPFLPGSINHALILGTGRNLVLRLSENDA